LCPSKQELSVALVNYKTRVGTYSNAEERIESEKGEEGLEKKRTER